MTPPNITAQELREIASVSKNEVEFLSLDPRYERPARMHAVIALACERWAYEMEADQLRLNKTQTLFDGSAHQNHHE